ncbi:hypothetical protein AHMF7605_27040 [Adhaeribacter arboris]|uniref:Uncharacterized protein n=1 Tax=Adhaeribacter arboris TaxID=2072846 RepID=A0A2T2YN06_9BACT|nr:hypothetical protein [Adhaeribacter arboris]PSR56893.1 hypothetical protein AHMF7605_27040 [Adhaeribacter arboris]
MEIIHKYLSPDDLNLIQKLVGEKIDLLYCKELYVDVSSTIIESHHFSLSCNKSYINFQNHEKGNEDYSYYEFSITESDTPLRIKREESGAMRGGSHVRLPASRIIRIDLFEDKAEEEWNSKGRELITVKYDSAFVFHLSNGAKFLLGVSESITEFTQFIWDGQELIDRLEGLIKRKEWK